MEKSQEKIIELMVNKVLDKHGVQKAKSISQEEKENLENIVEQLKSDVDAFVNRQNKSVTEEDFKKKRSRRTENEEYSDVAAGPDEMTPNHKPRKKMVFRRK